MPSLSKYSVLSRFSRLMTVANKWYLRDPVSNHETEVPIRLLRSTIGKLSAAGKIPLSTKSPRDRWIAHDWFHSLHLYAEMRGGYPNGSNGNDGGIRLFPNRQRDKNVVRLPSPRLLPLMDTADVLLKRRTWRAFKADMITSRDLSDALYYGARRYPLRSLDVYLIILRVDNIPRGVYRYNADAHLLETVREGDFTDSIYNASQRQYVDNSAVVFLISADYSRAMRDNRNAAAYSNIMIDAARLAHLIILTATCLGLKNFLTPAIKESITDDLLTLDGWSKGSLYLVAIGR